MATERTEALADALCNDIASGMSIKASCEHCGIPRYEFYAWQLHDEKFATRITHARAKQQDALVDDMREIADSATPEDWQVKRLQIWQRQWEASKLAPRKYGDKLAVGGDPDAGPIRLTWDK